MIGEIITWIFLGGALLFGACVVFFVWLNFRSSTIDDQSYDSDFHPEEMVSKYRYQREDPEDSFDAAHALRRYAHQSDSEESLRSDEEDENELRKLEKKSERDVSLMPSANDNEVIDVPHPKHGKRESDNNIVDADVIPETKGLPAPKPKLEEGS
jgi:hypothetical protein